jgi:radical SAM superfamily enzyme YgiQ (UPF0313 family)
LRYVGKIYRPPSEAHSYLLQATIGCSWNNCTYCDMYRDKPTYRVRPLAEVLDDIALAASRFGHRVDKVFVMDGDALGMPMEHWRAILSALARAFPQLRQVSCYATAGNVLEKRPSELVELRDAGLRLLYMGPESGDEATLRSLAKGPRPRASDGSRAGRDSDYLVQAHIDAAARARAAGVPISAIFLLGAGGVARSAEHAEGSAALITAMDPAYVSALTLTIVPGTPLERAGSRRGFALPDTWGLLSELRTIVALARPTRAVFRTNHASNHLPIRGVLPDDGPAIVDLLDEALAGRVALRPEWARGL